MSDTIEIALDVPAGVDVQVTMNGRTVAHTTGNGSSGSGSADEPQFTCQSCGWSASESEAPEEAVTFLSCPNCGNGRLESDA